jgi:hypothetical protein
MEKPDTSLDREYAAAVLKNMRKEGAIKKVRNVGVFSKPTKADIKFSLSRRWHDRCIRHVSQEDILT